MAEGPGRFASQDHARRRAVGRLSGLRADARADVPLIGPRPGPEFGLAGPVETGDQRYAKPCGLAESNVQRPSDPAFLLEELLQLDDIRREETDALGGFLRRHRILIQGEAEGLFVERDFRLSVHGGRGG